MSNAKFKQVTNYREADELLGKRNAMRVGYMTMLERLGGQICVRHHRTNIVTYDREFDHAVTLQADGWVSSTTANRMHKFTPDTVRVGRDHGEYVITDRDGTWRWSGTGSFAAATEEAGS